MQKLTAAIVCLIFGGLGCTFVLLNADHAARFGSSGQMVLLLVMTVSLAIGAAGFVCFLSWKDKRRKGPAYLERRTAMDFTAQPEVPARGVYALRPGVRYR